MDSCEHFDNGCCRIISSLTGLPLEVCTVLDDVCNACSGCEKSRTRNRVTASIAINAARKHLPREQAAAIKTELGAEIPVERHSHQVANPNGPGTKLKNILARIGIKPSASCSCNRHAREMDFRGRQWCLENIETIVEWLREEATSQKMPFFETAARMLVKYAVRKSS